MKNEFTPQLKLEKDQLIFNNEAVETMGLDSPNAKLMIISITNPDAKRKVTEMLVVKTNGSSLDKPEEINDIIPKEKTDRIRTVVTTSNEDGTMSASVPTTEELISEMDKSFGKEKEFKLLVCNADNSTAKEFKETFDISESFYRIVKLSDKRTALGKEKEIVENKNEERLKL